MKKLLMLLVLMGLLLSGCGKPPQRSNSFIPSIEKTPLNFTPQIISWLELEVELESGSFLSFISGSATYRLTKDLNVLEKLWSDNYEMFIDHELLANKIEVYVSMSVEKNYFNQVSFQKVVEKGSCLFASTITGENLEVMKEQILQVFGVILESVVLEDCALRYLPEFDTIALGSIKIETPVPYSLPSWAKGEEFLNSSILDKYIGSDGVIFNHSDFFIITDLWTTAGYKIFQVDQIKYFHCNIGDSVIISHRRYRDIVMKDRYEIVSCGNTTFLNE